MKINDSPLIVLLSCSILFSCTKVEEVEWESGDWIDLTHEFSKETLYWPTSEPFTMDTVFVGTTDAGFYYESYGMDPKTRTPKITKTGIFGYLLI